MKLVIDIDSYVLEHCKRHVREHYANNIEEAIANGTPLPTGHGRLIDADKLHQDIFDDDCWRFSGGISPNEGYSWKQVQNAPTIIEADKEDSNG